MQQEILSIITGAVVGVVFGVVGATVPAPPNIAGVLGIVGITIGYAVTTAIRG